VTKRFSKQTMTQLEQAAFCRTLVTSWSETSPLWCLEGW